MNDTRGSPGYQAQLRGEVPRQCADVNSEWLPAMRNSSVHQLLIAEATMPKDEHYRAAELHNLAAQAHRTAATHHGKEDHLTGHEYSKQAMEHSAKAHEASLEALQKSSAATKRSGEKS
jgi:hypothetical protein